MNSPSYFSRSVRSRLASDLATVRPVTFTTSALTAGTQTRPYPSRLAPPGRCGRESMPAMRARLRRSARRRLGSVCSGRARGDATAGSLHSHRTRYGSNAPRERLTSGSRRDRMFVPRPKLLTAKRSSACFRSSANARSTRSRWRTCRNSWTPSRGGEGPRDDLEEQERACNGAHYAKIRPNPARDPSIRLPLEEPEEGRATARRSRRSGCLASFRSLSRCSRRTQRYGCEDRGAGGCSYWRLRRGPQGMARARRVAKTRRARWVELPDDLFSRPR